MPQKEQLYLDDETQDPMIVAEHIARYRWACKVIQESGRREKISVLDLPCGTGFGAKILSDAGFSIHGIDLDAKAIETARENSSGLFEIGDATRLSLPEAGFDYVVSFEGIEHVHLPGRMLDEIYRVLKVGGSLLLSTPFAGKTGFPLFEYHVKEYIPSEMYTMLRAAGFRRIRYWGMKNTSAVYTNLYNKPALLTYVKIKRALGIKKSVFMVGAFKKRVEKTLTGMNSEGMSTENIRFIEDDFSAYTMVFTAVKE